jgi:DNA-binding transcriptional ArsR family regulator
MPAEQRRHVTNLRVLRAMANPVRYRIFSHLMAAGAQTASECAEVVGASASNCSYHLRELERFGLVERVPDAAGDGRERPWRTIGTGFSFHPADSQRDDPAARLASSQLLHLGIDDDAALAHAAADAHDHLPEAWRDAESMSSYGIHVTPAELRTIAAAVDAAIRPYIALTREDAPADAESVHVAFQAFRLPGTA